MREKLNLNFEIEDKDGNIIERCSVDVYITCFNNNTLSSLKGGLVGICKNIGEIINKEEV